MPQTLCVAVAAYRVERLSGWDDYASKLDRWVANAAKQGAQLLLFPEYAALELIALLPSELHNAPLALREALQQFWPQYLALHNKLAKKYSVAIVGGSFFCAIDNGVGGKDYRNRAQIFLPTNKGQVVSESYQDKLMMTREESEEWHISGSEGVRIFEWQGVKFGIAICYDSEFPTASHRLAQAGMQVLLVPSFTGSQHGFTRVRVGSMARALENQCYVLHSPLLAAAHWTSLIEDAVGQAAIYTPADGKFAANGIAAELAWNEAGWLLHSLDLQAVAEVRQQGRVLNLRDQPQAEQRSKLLVV